MILKYLSALWTAFAPALGNHLWQSTVFVIMAGSLTLILRKNQARARYWLWLAASVKFLIPFSLLIGIGSHLTWSRGSAGTRAGLYFAMEEVSQPFSQPTTSMISRAAPSTASPSLPHLLPALLAAVWLCGFLVVVFVWYMRWRRISAAIRKAVQLQEGREVDALRQLERIGGIRKRIEMLMSRTSLEPGIFGIARPVLMWPEGISERLEDAHLEAILAHEVWHVRRRDNLAAAIHMVVEASFWFYPLVWWLGARLVEERERACDEAVLELGTDRHVYAESILKICEFCVGSPLACVSGVTGADLKKRIVRVMTEGVMRKLDFSRRLLLSAAALAAIAVPVVAGVLNVTQTRAESRGQYEVVSPKRNKSDNPPGRIESQVQNTGAIAPSHEVASIKPNNPTVRIESQAQNTSAIEPAYEVVSIKPHKSGDELFKMMFEKDGFSAIMVTLRMLIRTAYGVDDSRIFGAPNWLDSEKYDVEARIENSVANRLGEMSEDQLNVERRRMLQALLAGRFKLTLHRQTTQLGVYVLVVANNGPKLDEAKPGNAYLNGIKDNGEPLGTGVFKLGRYAGGRGELVGQGLSMTKLLRLLSEDILNRSVIDSTGLTGNYDFTLEWKIGDESQGPMFKETEDHPQVTGSTSLPEFSRPSFFNAIQEQLGLKLESQNSPGVVLVIDHVEKPSEN
jgi:bla regulator protein BlaR1